MDENTALASTVGTANIIGVGTAIALGGPGAVLWIWLTGIFGMATKYAETVCLLSKLSKAKQHITVQLNMNELELTVPHPCQANDKAERWKKPASEEE